MVLLINEVVAAVASRKDPAAPLKVLQEVTVEHIQHENGVLWQIQSGTYEPLQKRPRTGQLAKMMVKTGFNEHMAEHRGFLARIDTIARDRTDTLCNELKAWFIDHALGYDAGLKAIFQATA